MLHTLTYLQAVQRGLLLRVPLLLSREQAFLCIPRLSALNTRSNGTDPVETLFGRVSQEVCYKPLPEILLPVYGRIGFLSSQAILPTELRGFPYTHAQLHKAHYKPLELWCGGGEADAPDAPVRVVYRENRQHAANRVLFKAENKTVRQYHVR